MEISVSEAFSAKWRITRKYFWLLQLYIYVLFWIFLAILLFFRGNIAVIYWICIWLYVISITLVTIFSYIKRLRDLDKNPWFTLLSFIPFINLFLLIYCGFFPWTKWKNSFWEDPLSRENVEEVKVEL